MFLLFVKKALAELLIFSIQEDWHTFHRFPREMRAHKYEER